MASPSKRLKRDYLNSTPNHFRPSSTTPSVSSISSNNSDKENVPVRNSRIRLSFVPEDDAVPGTSSSEISSEKSQNGSARRGSETSRSTPSEISGDDDYIGEDYDKYFKDLNRIQFKGQVWKLYKPTKEDTLYYNILNEPDDVYIVVTEWMLVYKTNPGNAIKSLIQFCIDLTGFTKFNVFHNYSMSNFKESNKIIIEKLEREEVIRENDLVLTGKYLLAERNVTLAKTLRMGIYNFIQKLIKLAYVEEVLYDQEFMVHFLEFLKQMTQCKVRSVKHTGVVIGIKALTSIILVYQDLINDPKFVMSASESTEGSQATQLAERKKDLEDIIECLYFVFYKNYRLPDDKTNQMRLECICEAKIWIKYFPKLFITQFQAVELIMKLVVDPFKDVRMAALCAFEELFNIPQVLEYLKSMKSLTKSIAQRFFDISIDVSKKAIDIFTLFIHIDQKIISLEQFNQLGKMIFEKNAVIGKAASKFFTNFFQIEAKTPAEVLLFINKIYLQRNEDYVKELIVEGFLYVCEYMRDWNAFCKIILSHKYDEETKTRVAELFSEAVYQYTTGKSDVMREMSKCMNIVDTNVHKKIAELFPKFVAILSQQSNPKILTEILRIILLVNYTFLEKNYCKECTDIANAARVIFNFHTDEKLFKNAAQVIFNFCSVVDLAKRAEQISRTVCNENVEDLQEFLNNPIKTRYLTVRRVATLYQHFNLNDQLTLEMLTCQIEDVDDKSALALLDCCRWHLIWKLKTLIDNVGGVQQQEFDQNAVILQKSCWVFCSIAFDLLQNEQKSHTFLLEVYGILCDFCRLFDKELEEAIILNKSFKMCEFKIKDDKFQGVLSKFLETSVICNKKMSLIDRRTNVIRYVDLIQIDVIPAHNIANVFKYYHVYYEDYSPIIDQCLTSFAETCPESAVYNAVIHTLLTVYTHILKKHSVIDIKTEEVSDLERLAIRFAAFKHFSKTNRNVYTLFYIWMKCAFGNDSKLEFLYFLKPFMSLINDSETHKAIYNNFKNLLPKRFEKHNAVLWLGNNFKRLQVKKVLPTPEPTKKPTATKEKEIVVPKTKRSRKDQKSKESRAIKSKSKTSKTKPTTSKKSGTETEVSSADDMTIHDSDSDDFSETMSSLRLQSNTSA